MKLRLMIAAALLSLALPTLADFQTVSRAYEVKLDNLTVPPSQNGRVLFKQCDDCETMAARMTPNTSFVVNGRAVRFERFRNLAREAKNANPGPVTVLHHLQSDTVVRISLTLKK